MRGAGLRPAGGRAHLVAGHPGPGFGEALACVFQARELELLGLPRPARGPRPSRCWTPSGAPGNLRRGPGGAGRLALAVPSTRRRPRRPRTAVLASRGPVGTTGSRRSSGHRDSVLLACSSHLIDCRLGLPDYPVGRLVAFQLQRRSEPPGSLGGGFQRMATLGRLTPDLWLERAAGGPLGAEPLLEAAEEALRDLTERAIKSGSMADWS